MPDLMEEKSPIPRRLSSRARSLALEFAAEACAEWGFATDILARAFRQERQLGSSERRLLKKTLARQIRVVFSGLGNTEG